MGTTATIAVEVTDPKYRVLRHPGGQVLDKDGKGVWPADQFTFRRIGDGALREQVAAPVAAPAPAPADPLTHLREIVTEAQHEIEVLQEGAVAPKA